MSQVGVYTVSWCRLYKLYLYIQYIISNIYIYIFRYSHEIPMKSPWNHGGGLPGGAVAGMAACLIGVLELGRLRVLCFDWLRFPGHFTNKKRSFHRFHQTNLEKSLENQIKCHFTKKIWKIWPSNVPKPRSFDISTLLYHWLHALFYVLKRLCDWCKQSLLQIGWQRPFLRPWINTLVLGKLLVAMDANHPIRLNPCCSSNCLKYRAKDFATHRCGKKNMFHVFSVINPWFQPDVW